MEKILEITETNVGKTNDEVIENIARQALEDDIYELADHFDDDQLAEAVRDIVLYLLSHQKSHRQVTDIAISDGTGAGSIYTFRITNVCSDHPLSFASCSNAYQGTGVSEAGYAFWDRGYDDIYMLAQNLLQAMNEAFCVCIGLI